MKWTSLTSAFEENLVNAEIRWVPLSSTSPFSFAFQISLNSP